MPHLEESSDDLRAAARSLWRSRAVTGAAVLTLALGIAGTAAMFALVEAVLLRPLPVPEQDRLILAWAEPRSGSTNHWPFRREDVGVISDDARTLESVAGISYYGAFWLAAKDGGVSTAGVTGDFFRVVGVGPFLGRVLNPADDVQGAEYVLVITRGLWQRRYGGSRDVIGRREILGGQPFTIVGVVPRDLEYPPGVEAWTTLDAVASTLSKEAFREGVRDQVDLVGRLQPHATIEQAASELQALTDHFEVGAQYDAPRGSTAIVRRFEDVVVGDARAPVIVLFIAVALVLSVASANLANLLLLRGVTRQSEVAVRAALGASPGRLARQLVAESLLLALTGGVAGLIAAWWVLKAVLALLPDGFPRIDSVEINAAVVAFALATAFLAALLAAVPSVLRARRLDVAAQLQRGRQRGSGRRRGRQALVVLQVALAVTVVAATGLLTRSLLRLQSVELGLTADRLAFVELGLPPEYEDSARHLHFLDDVVARLEAAPGIEGATPVNTPPFPGTGWDLPAFSAEGQSVEAAEANPSLNLEAVHPGYFATLGVTVVRGRGFAKADRGDSPLVAIVSEDVARRTWPGEDPIGKRLKFGGVGSEEPWRSVVGLASPTRYRKLDVATPTLYLPAEQFIVSASILVLRTTLPLALVARLAREQVHAVDPAVKVTQVTSFAERLGTRVARPRFIAFLIGLFALAALLLSAVGLYAVIGAHVRERSTEIGVRVALGATPSHVRRLVLGEGLRLAGLGAALGLGAAIAATRVLQGLLFEVEPLDPVSLLGAALLLVGASALASYPPARRATRVDPLSVLRTT
jgi:putative ABC transport system permease protein